MPIQRDAKLETRTGRKQLKPQHEPYWRIIHLGVAIGYRKSDTKAGVWKARKKGGGKYIFDTLGKADDFDEANGVDVLDYKQAHTKALAFATMATTTRTKFTVREAIREYLDNYKIENNPKPKTYRATESVIEKHILPALGDRLVNDLSFNELKNWRNRIAKPTLSDDEKDDEQLAYDRKRKAQASANRVMTYLKAALNFAFEHHDHITSDNAWRKLKPFRNVDAENVRPLTKSECKRLINACPPDFRAMVRAALYTGCRYGEIASMRVCDFNPDLKRITISKRIAKSSKQREIPLNADGFEFFSQAVTGKTGNELIFLRAVKHEERDPRTKEIIKTWHTYESWEPSHQKRRMDDACERANITPAATFHNLRDSYASFLVTQGVPLKAVGDLLGHSDTRVTERCYARFAQSAKDELVNKNLPSFGVEIFNVEAIG